MPLQETPGKHFATSAMTCFTVKMKRLLKSCNVNSLLGRKAEGSIFPLQWAVVEDFVSSRFLW